ncbi:hypothetical protein D3C84_565110 [compost metagenome]
MGRIRPRRPHAAAPETRHQYQGPGQPVFDPGFHRLAPLSLALATLWQADPFISGQKIEGICEGKMRLCEVWVKSGESPEKSAATSYSRTSEYASLFEPATQIATPHPNPLPRERGWPESFPTLHPHPHLARKAHSAEPFYSLLPLREKGWG